MTLKTYANQLIAPTCQIFKIIFYLLLFSISSTSFSQQTAIKAFPLAEGFGKYATGGRGGIVIKVTNLNDSGPGSLRQALQYTSGARTIVFEVGGTITLKSVLPIKSGDVTIAGQTAPGGGILIRGGHILIESSNVIIRYMRLRLGKANSGFDDSLSITAWGTNLVENIIIDHCSISWAEDENFEVRTVTSGTSRNVTLQNSIISEAIYGVLLYGPKVYNTTFYNNLFAHNSQRNVESNYPTSGTFQFEMVNNIVYGFEWATGVAYGTKFSVINNLYKKSSQTPATGTIVEMNSLSPGIIGETDAYLYGNIIPNDMGLYTYGLTPYVSSSPFSTTGIIPIPANQLETRILSHVGASLPVRDSVDDRIISQYKNGNGSIKTIGTYPIIQDGEAPVDSDNDGMPDEWEIANGLNPNDPDDRNIVQYDGYTNLEYFLNGMTLKTTVITANAGEDISICQGATTTLMASGGSTYLWNTGATTASIDVDPTETTTYTVTAYDSNGSNADSDEVTVTVKPLPNVDAGDDVTIEIGDKTTLTASGADSYLWSTGETTASIDVSPTSNTTYTVTGTINDCEASDTVTVFSVNASVKANAGEDTDICLGQTTTLTASGGTNYVWSTGETTESIQVTPETTTTFTVTVSDAYDQSDEASVTVTVTPKPEANAGEDQTICNGETATLTATGGTSYLWSTGETTASIEVNPTADTVYSVEVSTNNCSSTDEVSVFVKESPELTITGDLIIPEGGSTTLTVSGGYDYEWSTGETTDSITVSPRVTTTYSVSSISPSGCSSNVEIIVTVAQQVVANAGDDIEICAGTATILTASGGSTYLWSTGATTESIEVSPNETTNYSVTVYDITGTNSDTDEVTVTVNSLPTVDAGSGSTIDAGESVTLTATGATSYKWSNGETGETINVSPTATTTYTVIGTSNGCEATDTVRVTVTNTVEVVADAGADQSICAGSSATLTATGGTTYLWSTGATTESISVSPSSTTTYSVTAYDESGQYSDTDEVKVSVNALPTVEAGGNVTINSGDNVTLTATGATTYKWSNGATGASITVSPSTSRTYTVTGISNGCEATDTVRVTVTNTVEVVADAGADQSICAGSSATLTATGGATYLWSTGATTESISVSPSSTTTYSVTAYDESGQYSDTDEVKVSVNALPTVEAGGNVTINSGDNVTLTATGATTYKWSNGATGASITVSPSTSRTYTVTGISNGCEATDTVRVTVTNTVEVVADAGADQSICAGSSATLTATGGATYLWSTGATTESISVSPSSTTTYSVTAYDESGQYSDTDEVNVTVNSIPTVSAGKNITITSGDSTTLTASGAKSYKWSTGETGTSINVSPSVTTTYTVKGTINGCEASATVKVTVETPRVFARAGGNKDICQGSAVTLTATGGDRYLWSTGEKTASITVNPQTTTKYSVTAYIGDASGTDDATVKVSPKPNVRIINGSEADILEGEFITLSAKGADSYKWSNGATQPNIAVRPTKTQTFDVVGYINDCSSEKSIKVNVFEKIVANAGDDVAICSDESTVLTARGPANSEYLWSTGETTKSITVNPEEDTEYSVMVYHELDSDTDSVMVKVRNCANSQIVDGNVALEDTVKLDFLIHPNPTYGEVHIKISGLSDASSIHLYDLSGKSLYTEAISIKDHKSYNKTIDLSDFASGIYLLQLVDNQRVITKKVVLR